VALTGTEIEANPLQVLMLQPGPTPGRDATGATPPAQPPSATGAPDRPGTPAPAPSSGLLGNLVVMAPILLMVVVLFFISRADRKKRQQLESQLKKGDRVVTRSGLIGKLTEVNDSRVRLEIAPGVHVTMLKNALEGLDTGDAASTTSGSKSDKKDDKSKDDKSKDDKSKDGDKDKEPDADSKKKK
jgi:preprotein translocase subunit YajC